MNEIEREREETILAQSRFRQNLLEKTKKLQEFNLKSSAELKHNRAKTQVIKKERQSRDLKYELAVLKVSELKSIKTKNHYNNDQKSGIENFEKIMKRNGIGSSDSGGDVNSISHEDGEEFLNRIESTAASKWPSNEEISDFVTQLKQRTLEKRVARYEKARRRRRALVDQAAAAASSDAIEEEASDGNEF